MVENLASSEPDLDQVAKNFAHWFAAMEASHAMLMAGLRDEVGADGDIQQAYRDWKNAYRSRKQRAYRQAAKRYEDRARETMNGSPMPPNAVLETLALLWPLLQSSRIQTAIVTG